MSFSHRHAEKWALTGPDLARVRLARQLTIAAVAKEMEVTEPRIAQLELQQSVFASTSRRYLVAVEVAAIKAAAKSEEEARQRRSPEALDELWNDYESRGQIRDEEREQREAQQEAQRKRRDEFMDRVYKELPAAFIDAYCEVVKEPQDQAAVTELERGFELLVRGLRRPHPVTGRPHPPWTSVDDLLKELRSRGLIRERRRIQVLGPRGPALAPDFDFYIRLSEEARQLLLEPATAARPPGSIP